jgi:hypothetical protein
VSGVRIVSMRGVTRRVRTVSMGAMGFPVALLVIHMTSGDAFRIGKT